METESETVTNLVAALKKANFMAKHLSSSSSTTARQDSANIYASLHAAHRNLSIFLAHNPPQPQICADVTLDDDGDDSPMQLGDQDQDEEDSKMITVEKVEERMKDCFIHNKYKRRKRSLSPASLAAGELEPRNEFGNGRLGTYDPHLEKLRALDLIYQFHC